MKKKSIALFTTIASSILKLSLSVLIASCFSYSVWAQVKEVKIAEDPKVDKKDLVNLRVKVKDSRERPVFELEEENFRVFVDSEEVPIENWQSPRTATPPPAWIVVLLDMSGSMKGDDSRGTSKLQGAVNAIRKLSENADKPGSETRIAVVPFGEKGSKCSKGYKVNTATLEKFFSAGHPQIDNYLTELQQEKPCASTNLYQPLIDAVDFLGDRSNTNFYPPEDSSVPQVPQPRLSIIFLSDGFHTEDENKNPGGYTEQDYLNELSSKLKRNPDITIHTLGYGLTPEQLGKKYNLGGPAKRSDVNKTVPENEFVDQEALAKIAGLTGGITEFSADESAISRSLERFLQSILGEYKITFADPEPIIREKQHNVYVEVNNGKEVISPEEIYRSRGFGLEVPWKVRRPMWIGIFLILVLGGILPFWLWGQQIKQQALDD